MCVALQVVVTGSWGDQPGRVNANYHSPDSFWVNWLPSGSMRGFTPPRYWVQVRKDKDFATLLPHQATEDGSPLFYNATVEKDDFKEANNLDYRFLIEDAEVFAKYYIRVYAFNIDGDWGPPRVSDPTAMVPQPVEVLNVKGGRNIPLNDGLILLETTLVGTGQNVRSLPVFANMVNGTGGRSYRVCFAVVLSSEGLHIAVCACVFLCVCVCVSVCLCLLCLFCLCICVDIYTYVCLCHCQPPRHPFPDQTQATNCEYDLDGVHLVCDAPSGVGAKFQWEVTVNGHRGIISPPAERTQTNFFSPVVAGFRTEENDLLLTSHTSFLSSSWIAGTGAVSPPLSPLGGELIHVYGRNFGTQSTTWGVRAWWVSNDFSFASRLQLL